MLHAVLAGFVDGKLYVTCKPIRFQRSIYNGGKHRKHGLHGQSVIDAWGLHMHFFCPISGRRNDAFVWEQSRVQEMLDRVLGDERVKCLFGDSAYPTTNRVRAMAKNPLTEAAQNWNRFAAGLRIAVEHGIGKTTKLWPLLNCKDKMRVFLSPIALWINVAVFFTNCHTCLYGAQVAEYFNCVDTRPSLEEYINIDAVAP